MTDLASQSVYGCATTQTPTPPLHKITHQEPIVLKKRPSAILHAYIPQAFPKGRAAKHRQEEHYSVEFRAQGSPVYLHIMIQVPVPPP